MEAQSVLLVARIPPTEFLDGLREPKSVLNTVPMISLEGNDFDAVEIRAGVENSTIGIISSISSISLSKLASACDNSLRDDSPEVEERTWSIAETFTCSLLYVRRISFNFSGDTRLSKIGVNPCGHILCTGSIVIN